MPDIKGWSSNEVITLCKLLKINYQIEGFGRVDTFSIEPGTTLTNETKLEVTLK